MEPLVPASLGCIALLIALAGVHKHSSRQRRRVPDAVGADLRYLIHAINDDRCTGCSTCVDACPTNVLELLSHKSRPARFQDCVQCEKCARVCPTSALAMHLVGEEPPQIMVPEVDESYQTQVPGQYLIGEVAGKPLVKNAANLGRAVIEHIVQSGLVPRPTPSESEVDVIIVGSGPGGLSAALSCQHRGLSYVVLEKERIMAATVLRYPAGKPFMAEPQECENLSLLPVFDSSKETLVETWNQLVQTLGVKLKLDQAVNAVLPVDGGGFEATTSKGSYRGQRVVLAIGVRGKPRTLDVPGNDRSKVHLLLEDPNAHAGHDVLVVGGGDTALEAAIALAGTGARVTLSYRKKSFSRAKAVNQEQIDTLAQSEGFAVLFQSNVKEIRESEVTVTLKDGSEMSTKNDACFILIGADPPVKWLSKHGVGVVARPHSYSAGATDASVRRLAADARACSTSATAAAQRILGTESAELRPPTARAESSREHVPLIADAIDECLMAGSPRPARPRPRRMTTLGDLCRRLRDAARPEKRSWGELSSVQLQSTEPAAAAERPVAEPDVARSSSTSRESRALTVVGGAAAGWSRESGALTVVGGPPASEGTLEMAAMADLLGDDPDTRRTANYRCLPQRASAPLERFGR